MSAFRKASILYGMGSSKYCQWETLLSNSQSCFMIASHNCQGLISCTPLPTKPGTSHTHTCKRLKCTLFFFFLSSPAVCPLAVNIRLHDLCLVGQETELRHQQRSMFQWVAISQLTCTRHTQDTKHCKQQNTKYCKHTNAKRISTHLIPTPTYIH